MRRSYPRITRLALVVLSLWGPTIAWSDEQPVQASPRKLQKIERRQYVPPLPPSENDQAIFPPPSQWRGTVFVGPQPTHQKMSLAQRHRYVATRVDRHLDESKNWFCYIKGNGPAVWVHE